MKKKFRNILIILLILFLISPIFQYFKSLIVMSVNNYYEGKHSLLKEEKIEIKMPGGLSTAKKDWYPFVNYFNLSKGFSNYLGKDVKLSILYNFASFDYLKGSSYYYDKASEYFNSFYGAYIVKGKDTTFGYYEDGLPNYNEMAMVPEYDMKVLVLEGFGCEDPIFEFIIDKDYSIDMFGYDEWNVMEAKIITNSPMHRNIKYRQAYLQYGKPSKSLYEGEEFPLVEMEGKFYSRYFKEKECSIFFYIIAPKMETINEWELNILNKTRFKIY